MSEVAKKALDAVGEFNSRVSNGAHKFREEHPTAHKAVTAGLAGLNLLALVNGGVGALIRSVLTTNVIGRAAMYANGKGHDEDYSADFRGETITGKQRDVREFIYAVEKLEKISENMQKSSGEGFAAEVAQGVRRGKVQAYMSIIESKADRIFVQPKSKPNSNGPVTF